MYRHNEEEPQWVRKQSWSNQSRPGEPPQGTNHFRCHQFCAKSSLNGRPEVFFLRETDSAGGQTHLKTILTQTLIIFVPGDQFKMDINSKKNTLVKEEIGENFTSEYNYDVLQTK